MNKQNLDLEFVRRCIAADPDAWNAFIERYSRLIYSAIHATLRLKGYDSRFLDSVGDIFQDVFAFLQHDTYKKLKTYQGKNGCSFASWLRLVTVRRTIDYLRKQKNMVSLDAADEEGNSLSDICAAAGVSARDSCIGEDVLFQLAQCIDGLPGDDRYCLELLFRQRLSPVEVGQTLGISRQAVDMRKMRFLDKLKDCFRKKGLLDL